MIKAYKAAIIIVVSVTMLPFLVLWTIAGHMAHTLWTLFEVFDGTDNI